MTGCALATSVAGTQRRATDVHDLARVRSTSVLAATGLVGIVAGIKVADDHAPLGNSILVAGCSRSPGFYVATIGYVRWRKDAIVVQPRSRPSRPRDY
jgi:hypothetical protein